MLAILKLIPGVHYVYAALIAALVAAFISYTVHERHLGAAREAAAIKASSDKLRAENAAELQKQALEDDQHLHEVSDAYQAALTRSAAVADDLSRRLRNATSGSKVALPGDPATPAGPDVPATIPVSVERAIEGVIDAAGHDADQVTALQQYITEVCTSGK